MTYFIDTNILVYYFNNKFPTIRARLGSIPQEEIKIPSMVAAELLYGAYKSAKRDYNLSRYRLFFERYEITQFDYAAAECYGEIRSDLESKGAIIGWNDMLIASIVKANNGVLVTNNTDEFSRVKGLQIDDWTGA